MKKGSWKKWMVIGLTIMTSLTIAGCGKKTEENGPEGGNAETVSGMEAAKQYVYHYKELDFLKGGEQNVLCSRKSGDKVELLVQNYTYTDEGQQQTVKLYSMNTDGTGVTSTDMYVEPNTNEGGYSDPGEVILFDKEPVAETDEKKVTDEVIGDELVSTYDYYPESEDYTYENTYISSAVILDDGIYALKNHTVESYSEGNYVSKNNYIGTCWNRNGEVQFEAPIDMEKYQNEDTYSYVSNIVSMGDGKIGLLMNGQENGIITVEKNGTVSNLKPFTGAQSVLTKDPMFAVRPDGSYLVGYYNDDWSKMYVTTFDPKTGSVGDGKEVPLMARNQGMYNFFGGTSKDVIYVSNDGIYGFNIGDTEVSKIMDFVNSDFEVDYLYNYVNLDDTHFLASFYDTVDYTQVMGLFTYVKPEDIQDRKVLVYAGIYVDSSAKQAIIRFNKKETEYRITIKDYGIYNTEEDQTLGETKFNNDVIAGNIPDIFEANNVRLESFAAKGVLADVEKLIKSDPELSKLEFMENVFDAYRIDGTLYQVIPRYVVSTWIGKKSMVGSPTKWTMEDVKKAGSKLSGEKNLFGMNLTRADFIYTLMSYGGSDFVDLNTGKCNFDNQNFIALLEYAKTLPEELPQSMDDDWEEFYQKYQSQYRENRTLLMECSLYDLSSIKYNVNGMMGEDVSYVGFPTESGSGSYIRLMTNYALYEKSPNKDGAWKFLRTFLTEDYQKNEDYKYGYVGGMPILKKMVREMADQTMEKPYYIDENGNKQEWDDYYYINGQEIVIEPFTKAQADEIYNFVCTVNKPTYYDENVYKIVEDETKAFFAGSKSAKDVAGNIQNRVQLYVNENR